jgi:histidine triad (HIT) family protein
VDCIFCKIVSGEISSKKVYEDEKILAFHDLDPKAPVHVIVIPKKHIASVEELSDCDQNLIGHVFLKIAVIARERGCNDGYRIVNNCGKLGGQTVNHLHFHILGGRAMSWPPG